MTRSGLAGLVVAAAALILGPAAAQENRGGPSGDFDFYVLALTWSPGFCALEGDRREQCEPGRGLRFVVHGLWPQYERGFPTACGAYPRQPTRAALDEAAGLFPDEGLARHQWRKHGTCAGKSPSAYFRDVRLAREKVQVPAALDAVAQTRRAAPPAIERAFVDANPGLRTDMMAVVCRRGVLQEVRICLEKDLRGFRTCPEVDRNDCGADAVRVDPPR